MKIVRLCCGICSKALWTMCCISLSNICSGSQAFKVDIRKLSSRWLWLFIFSSACRRIFLCSYRLSDFFWLWSTARHADCFLLPNGSGFPIGQSWIPLTRLPLPLYLWGRNKQKSGTFLGSPEKNKRYCLHITKRLCCFVICASTVFSETCSCSAICLLGRFW